MPLKLHKKCVHSVKLSAFSFSTIRTRVAKWSKGRLHIYVYGLQGTSRARDCDTRHGAVQWTRSISCACVMLFGLGYRYIPSISTLWIWIYNFKYPDELKYMFWWIWKICPKGPITINYSKYVGHWQSQVLSHCIKGQSIAFLLILLCAVLWSELMIFLSFFVFCQHGIEYHWGAFF